jgi:hypothetical protein
MRRHVGTLARAVALGGDDRAATHDDGADRNLAARARGSRLGERPVHEAFRTLAHRRLLCSRMIPKSGCRFSAKDHAQSKR